MEDQKEAIINAYSSQEYDTCLTLLAALPLDAQNSNEMRILKASCFINQEDRISDAHAILDDIIAKDGKNSFAYYGKGLAFLKEQKLVESVANFTKAATLDKTGMISKAQVMKLQTEKMLKSQRKSKRVSFRKRPESEKKSAVCDICHKTFAQQYSLNRHMLLHSATDRPIKCTICPSGFVQKSDLTKHMASTHGEKKVVAAANKHKCDICGKDFKYSKLMKLHRITHSSRQKMKCDFCEKVFVTKPSLNAHIMSHINRNNKANRSVANAEPKTPKTKLSKVFNPASASRVHKPVEVAHDLKRVKLEPPQSSASTDETPVIMPPTPSPSPPLQESLPRLSMQQLSSFSANDSAIGSVAGGDSESNPEWNFFFKSLMHDLGKMDDKQKRKFRLKTFSLIDEILE